MFNNIPEVKLGLIAVSRDCFVISLSERRRAAVAAAYKELGGEIYECKVTVENEKDMLRAVEDVKAAGCTALVVFLGNFGPETPETLIAQNFDGPVMYAAAAEESMNDLINGRGDAYCGGVLYGLLSSDMDCAKALAFGNACSAVKNTIPGDLPSSDLKEIEYIIEDHNTTGRHAEMNR